MIFQPDAVIVPILALCQNKSIKHFLGTGAFIGSPPLLLTADHVIRDWPELFGVARITQLNQVFAAEIVKRDKEHDLALLQVHGYEPPNVLPLAEEGSTQLNQFMATLEYGPTTTAGSKIKISPATRLGNITRIIDATCSLGPAGEEALELSFPALRGASGAPVVTNDGMFRLHGVVVANVSYHLLPAQIASILDEKNEILEETQFMLPQALAVNVKHVRALLRAIQPEEP